MPWTDDMFTSAFSIQQSAVSRKRLQKLPALPVSPELKKQDPNTYHGDTEHGRIQ
jgi:hypothetical protein